MLDGQITYDVKHPKVYYFHIRAWSRVCNSAYTTALYQQLKCLKLLKTTSTDCCVSEKIRKLINQCLVNNHNQEFKRVVVQIIIFHQSVCSVFEVCEPPLAHQSGV